VRDFFRKRIRHADTADTFEDCELTAAEAEQLVYSVDLVLRSAAGRPPLWRDWQRIDNLLDERNAIRPPRPAQVPVIPGRSS
jgi:hypothetical protein